MTKLTLHPLRVDCKKDAVVVPSTGLLQVDLGAIRANWSFLQAQLSNRAQCGAVVKANAYGLGVDQVASALLEEGCRRFFVATLEEGIALRECLGGSASIIVMGGIARGDGDDWLEYSLAPVLFECGHLAVWRSICQRAQQALPCVFKVDTGMHRLGMDIVELLKLLKGGQCADFLDPIMLMSHLACADTPDHSLNARQLSSFESAYRELKSFFPDMQASLCNSAGIFLGEAYHFDWCRPGIALYGGNPQPTTVNIMKPVVNLFLPVMQVRTIQAGESVGYGGTFVAQRQTRLATVFGGYADGLFRCLSNRSRGWVKGYSVPLVGRVSMDSLVFDITDLELSEPPEFVELLGENQSVDQLATDAGTIPYEILTSLGGRYHRHYVTSNVVCG